uniref:hypothetical protein n=1 Tax=Paralagenidium karlingii TaxID=1440115 RepID=UPI0026E1A2BD|nr:hypothetical protein Q6B14_mgp18 [Paralagenidium karlingii]WJH17931.1 hypothetical protein [Paralagenidium karlingii]
MKINKLLNYYQNIIKNEDVFLALKFIKEKYKIIYKILKDNNMNDKEKQKKIIEICSNTSHLEKRLKIDQIFKINFSEELKEKKEIKKEHLNIIELLEEGIDSITLFTLNEFIIKNKITENNDILIQKFISDFQYNLKMHTRFKKFKDPWKQQQQEEVLEGGVETEKILFDIIMKIIELCSEYKILDIIYKTKMNKTRIYIKFNNNFIRYAIKHLLSKNNLPLIIEPTEWIFDEQNEVTITSDGGGYLYKCQENEGYTEFLTHYNKDKSKMTCLKNKYLEAANYLQSQKFEINTNHLQELISNPHMLFEEDEIIFLQENTYEMYKKKVDPYNIQKNLKEHYDIKKIKILNKLELIVLALVYKNHNFYYTIFTDFRNRLYYTAYLLNPQGNKRARYLINLKTCTELVSLDAVASGLQMFGLLLKNDSFLEKTRLIQTQDLTQTETDLYIYYKNKFNFSPLNYIETIIKEDKETVTKKPNSKGIHIKIQKQSIEFQDRKIFKKLLMTHTYNQTVYGMANYIKKETDFLNDLTFSEIMLHMQNVKKFFKQEFKDIDKLNEILIEVGGYCAKQNKPIILGKTENTLISQYYAEQKSKKFHTIYKKKKIQVTFKKDITPLKQSIKRAKRAIMPNLIHSLDSHLLYKVAYQAKKEQIPLYTIHDCYVTDEKYKQKIKDFYLKAAQEIMETNLVKKFIINNTGGNEELQKKLLGKLQKIRNSKKIILLDNKNCLKEEKKHLH